MVSKDSFNKIIFVVALFTISLAASSILFTHISSTQAYTNVSVDPSTKSVIIEVPPVSTPTLPTYASVDKWRTGATTYTKLDAVLIKETTSDKYITSNVNNDHQTYNFEKIAFQPGTVINKIDLIATAKKSGPQTTKMSLVVAKGTTTSDLPLGGIPMTTSYVDYIRDVTKDPASGLPFTLTEVSTWQSGGTGVPLTFGVAQNTDSKDVLVTKISMKINFKDEIVPTTTAQINGASPTGGTYAPGAIVSLGCSDPTPGSGPDKIEYKLNGSAFTTYAGGITVSQPGTNTILYRCVDKVGNTETTKTLTIEIQKLNTTISLAEITSVTQGAKIYVHGSLNVAGTTKGVPNKSITFTSNPSVTLEPATTGGVQIVDSGIVSRTCSGSDKLIQVHQGAEITVPGNPTYVDFVFCGTTATFNLLVTAGGATNTQSVGSGETSPPVSDVNGITKIKIDNVVGGDGTIGITSLAARNAAEQVIFSNEFDDISDDLSVDGTTLLFSGGTFSTKGTAPSAEGQNYLISAKFDGDVGYYASDTASQSYDVNYSPGGIGADTTTIADVTDLIVINACDTDTNAANDDTDLDGICDVYETGGIPYTAGTTQRFYPLAGAVVGKKDVYVEADSFVGHTPNANAISRVVQKFTDHNMNLHVAVSDTNIPEVIPVNIWRDIDTNRGNDFDSIKASYFGNAADRVTFTGTQTNSVVSGTSVKFSGLSITTPLDGGTTPINSVHGTIILKMKLNLSASPSSISPGAAISAGDATGLNIDDTKITSTITSSSSTVKILTTKIPFKTTAQVSNVAVGDITIPLTISGATVSTVSAENVSPVIFTTKQQAMAQVMRYALFAHGMGGPSGRAELRGNDMVIALGAYTQVNSHGVGSEDEQAGTFMHELGHLLNLDHGGYRWAQPATSDNPTVLGQSLKNCKPNYISVMSYSRQLPGSYLNQAAAGGAGGWILDYSNGLMPAVDEKNLNENNGLVSTTSFAPRIVWGTPGKSPIWKGGNFVTAAGGTPIHIDWDGSGVASDVFVNTNKDINNFGIFGCQATTADTTLTDSNDWANMDFRIKGSANSGDGASVDELNEQQLQQQTLATANYIIIPPPAADGTETRNKGSALPIKTDLQTQTGIDITYATLRVEYYTATDPIPKLIGSATYSSSLGFYQVGWKTPNKADTYYVNVYIENPISSETDRLLVNPTPPLLLDNQNPPHAVTIMVKLT
ncbi:MAG TPA: hypothetical protein VLD38_00310 [Nitrosopumilaceae archaeon]|nr:hypothetical protein [Nitrosopumilaceae archaeon]